MPERGLPGLPAVSVVATMLTARHDVYQSQYRAMFVLNCVVRRTETLKAPTPKERGRKRTKEVPSCARPAKLCVFV